MTPPRQKIVDDYARWTALSALRSGVGHPKAAADVYRALEAINFDRLLDRDRSAISEPEFAQWHRASVQKLDGRSFCVGWAAKLINVYLKTCVYLAGDGRTGLKALIHPPIDAGLWAGVKAQFPQDAELDALMHPHDGAKKIETISGIKRYEHYSRIIEGCRRVARRERCKLIEVEQFWSAVGTGKHGL